MLEVGIIEPITESKWISLMVVHDKKKGGIIICVDLRKLNDAFLHDMFPTWFTDEFFGECRRKISLLIYKRIFWVSPK
jgi:hypothetical protein